ncbi:hypothetical protein CDQ85_00405 [Clostridium thermosuccinogenes]|nr:hypothetical protein CDO33_16395 [Pseudoclostridium thermosuccinogenes]PNT94170.1 hypothetical protein CDQ83_12030 [Pseudoclostridium thermosuccinogenes]PNU00181.1 hypothetical protein CDQ85_00405 [Pseudoclostridium thermosuccinogenes]
MSNQISSFKAYSSLPHIFPIYASERVYAFPIPLSSTHTGYNASKTEHGLYLGRLTFSRV